VIGLGFAIALGCEASATPGSEAASAASGSALTPSLLSHPVGERYVGRPLAQPSSPPAASPVAAPSASSPAPIPSLVSGKAACDACLEAEKSGRYLTPRGVGHYLVGCDDDVVRKQCLAATKRSIPLRVRELVGLGKCDDARALVQFAVRENAGSPTLGAALGACKLP